MKKFDLIRDWGKEKGIINDGHGMLGKATPETQFGKLLEEVTELHGGLTNDDQEEVIDAIGDCVVVLTLLAELRGVSIETCIESAYDVISKRTGKMVNGTFVKDN